MRINRNKTRSQHGVKKINTDFNPQVEKSSTCGFFL